jgi:hypothetical protein
MVLFAVYFVYQLGLWIHKGRSQGRLETNGLYDSSDIKDNDGFIMLPRSQYFAQTRPLKIQNPDCLYSFILRLLSSSFIFRDCSQNQKDGTSGPDTTLADIQSTLPLQLWVFHRDHMVSSALPTNDATCACVRDVIQDRSYLSSVCLCLSPATSRALLSAYSLPCSLSLSSSFSHLTGMLSSAFSSLSITSQGCCCQHTTFSSLCISIPPLLTHVAQAKGFNHPRGCTKHHLVCLHLTPLRLTSNSLEVHHVRQAHAWKASWHRS